jgi:hypothetical protein
MLGRVSFWMRKTSTARRCYPTDLIFKLFDIGYLRFANVASEISRYPHLATPVGLSAALHATVLHWLDYY